MTDGTGFSPVESALPAAGARTPPVAEAGGRRASWREEVAEQAPGLGATYWLDAGPDSWSGPHTVAITFTGIRDGGAPATDARDRFERVEIVEGILPGSGRISVTVKVEGINPGTWQVTATPVILAPAGRSGAPGPGPRLQPALQTVPTRLAPLVRGPGVRPFAWPLLVAAGVALALLVQGLLAARAGLDTGAVLSASLAGSVVGYVTAKAYYMVQHRQNFRQFVGAGTCIQGFLLGAFGTALAVVAGLGLPVGTWLDVAAPGAFLAMATARPGCFLGGCCVGRPTTSRWGLWSSDRRVGIRRVPTQLIEALLALALGAATLTADLTWRPAVPGTLFVAAMAAYTLGRQLLFPLRAEARRTKAGRSLTVAATLLVLLAAFAAPALA
ncbi:prolipoprotein diacylglyceryl transferase family protein [Streptomyces chiangmaiensis]|uniref:Prolipoprotein diacylglyceryl transferase family protein n=1 Tax=Streptomyces chiangmaiensis TaxID=766497 RepID=A0ABU7FMG0_9ACTN|nr:prolipoprotein diacylglyceryl transferase family protein [Streptomyces chiangmaiensis]MED7825315.1 prolipoprotein diacylglyceryl transferase family protein [Streptomyces chiangmaiensis]